MNLIVDIGNSNTKLAVYNEAEKISVTRVNELSCEEIEKMLSGLSIEKAIVSSVKELPPFMEDLLFPNIPLIHFLSYKSKLPFRISYDTPETLGTDRIAAIAGAYFLFPGKEVLVIDAGTALTYDFLEGDTYTGGNISPGLSMRFKALNMFTGRLPLVKPSESYTSPGRNTTDAIAGGVITGVLYEINEYIRTFEKEHIDSKIILTGGDSGLIKKYIKLPLIYVPDIVTNGLNYILEYNAK
jgi:type III pantothenate kinase